MANFNRSTVVWLHSECSLELQGSNLSPFVLRIFRVLHTVQFSRFCSCWPQRQLPYVTISSAVCQPLFYFAFWLSANSLNSLPYFQSDVNNFFIFLHSERKLASTFCFVTLELKYNTFLQLLSRKFYHYFKQFLRVFSKPPYILIFPYFIYILWFQKM